MVRKSATNRRLSVIDDYPNSMCAHCRNGSRCSKAFSPIISTGNQIGGYITGCVNFDDVNRKNVKRSKHVKDNFQLELFTF